MHFHFEKLGLLDQIDLELADLTLICGENNTGKTYATYAVYGFLRNWRGQVERRSAAGDLDLRPAPRNLLDLDPAALPRPEANQL